MPGQIIYSGPSMLDGAPIVVIAITGSSNRKTGDMVQTYIIRADVHPLEALKTGDDASVCGDCGSRPALAHEHRAPLCYVTVAHGPSSVFNAFVRGAYPPATTRAKRAAIGRKRHVRLGTYGDPMAAPAYVWRDLISQAEGHTGYTHQWMRAGIDARQRRAISNMCMASADNQTQAEMAQSIGLRTFRVRAANEPVIKGEAVCPASAEAGKKRTCQTCMACDGTRDNRAASIVIMAHGSGAHRYNQLHAA